MKAGGKSRKTGGVSRRLISKLKEDYSTNSKSSSSCGKKSNDGKHTTLFDTVKKTK